MATIGRDLKQRKPFPTKEQEAAVTLLRTADVLRRHIGSVVGRRGITLQQYNVLRILRGAAPDGLPTLEIASRMIETAPGITRLLERLQNKNLVDRERKRDDKRCVVCRITPAGTALVAALDDPVRDATGEAFRSVNKHELAQLVGSLDRMRASLEKEEES